MSSQQSAENRPLKRKMILQQQMAHFLFLRTIGLGMFFSPISINCFVYVCVGVVGGEGIFN